MELLTRKPPFVDVKFVMEIKNCVVEGKPPALEDRVQHLGSKRLVGRCLEQRAEGRLVIGEILGAPSRVLCVG